MTSRHDERVEEARIEALLQKVGARVTPPEDLMKQVRAAVKGEWQAAIAERAGRRRVRVFAAAVAFAAIAAVGIAISVMSSAPAAELARVTRIEGHVMRDAGLLHAARDLATNAAVYVGDAILTARDARAAFHIDHGLSVRLDENTHVRLVDADRLVLERGAVYVASDPTVERFAAFTVITRNGTVRHIGTQYEVRSFANDVQVSVREGRVVIDTDGALREGKAGERIAIGNDGAVNRTPLAQNDLQWQWVYRIAPRFDIENQSLDAFLQWYSRETGRTISFASPEVTQAARTTILRGSIEGLAPNAALTAVLATTELTSAETSEGVVVILAKE